VKVGGEKRGGIVEAGETKGRGKGGMKRND
jgi:hypothetical protein